jgi:excisionase family DNA binding protein
VEQQENSTMDDEFNQNEHDVMTVSELARYLRVQDNTVYAALAENKVPHLRLSNGCIRISRKVIDQILRGELLPR